jgi:hypothetical protein
MSGGQLSRKVRVPEGGDTVTAPDCTIPSDAAVCDSAVGRTHIWRSMVGSECHWLDNKIPCNGKERLAAADFAGLCANRGHK